MQLDEDFSPEYLSEIHEMIFEELSPEQKKTVDSWYSYGNPHKEIFGNQDRIRIPYDESQDKNITHSGQVGAGNLHHNIVLDHLQNLGYKTDDYASGLAYHPDTPNRKVRIGSLLTGENDKPTFMHNKHDQQMTVSQVYAADPLRAAKGKEKEIVISKNRYDVAGMSTNRNWSSCMDMNGGCNKHYLPHDIAAHTMTSYLVKKGEDPDKNPLARLNIKQFVHTGSGKNIYRPENAVYGAGIQGFHKQVEEWSQKHYPSEGGFYTKNASVYNDDGNVIKIEKPYEDTEKMHKGVEQAAYNHVHDIREKFENHDFEEEPWGPDEHEDHGHTAISMAMHDIHDALPHKDKIKSIIHHMHINSGDDVPEDYEVFDHHADDKALHAYAVDQAERTFGRNKNPFADFSPGESIEQLQKLHENGKDHDANYMNKTQENLMDAHHDLLNHVFSNKGKSKEWDTAIDTAVHHISTPGMEDYYGEDGVNAGHNRYLVQMTKNPRLMHTMLDNNEQERESTFNHHPAIQHIGEHADAKLAEHLMHHDELGDGHKVTLIHGLNDNPNGEHIQHHLTRQMGLFGGENKHGEVDEAGEMHKDMFENLAQQTKFKSVYDKLKSRSDSDLDHPHIHNALKANKNFYQPTMEERQINRYLRALGK